MSRSSSDESSEDVFSSFITRSDTVADHERHRSEVVCDYPYRNVGVSFSVFVFHAGDLNDTVEYMFYSIYIEYRVDALHDACETLEPHSRIDIRMREIRVVAFVIAAELSEYVVPELYVSVAVASRFAVRIVAAVLFASVIVDLRTWTARTGSDLPEVVVLSETDDPFLRQTDHISPDSIRIIVILVNSSPELVGRHMEHLSDELPAPCQRLLLEIVSERKASEHFKKCTVS